MASTAQINIKVDSKQADGSVKQLNEDLNKTSTATQSLRTQLRQVREELANLDEGSARFAELSQRAGQLADQIADTQKVIQSTAGSAVENLGGALQKTASIGIAAFQGIASAQALFGVESEELQQTLVKLQALAGLSDAINSLGGIKDTFNEIKAGVLSAANSMGLLTTATVAETAATEGATVAQEGLNVAMKANPIGILLTAVLALGSAYAILSSQFGGNADNAKKLAEQKKRLNEESKKQRDYVAGEAAGYVQLVAVLSQTKNGTKEREQVLKQLNSTYGTHLKNIKDENAFQNQLNKSVDDYIKFKTLEYAMMANEEQFKTFIAKKFEAQKDLSAATKAYNDELAKQSSITTTLTVLEVNKLNDLKRTRDEAAGSLTRIDNTLKYLTKQTQDAAEQMGKFNIESKYLGNTQTETKTKIDDTTKEIEKQTDAIDRYNESVKNIGIDKQLLDFGKFLVVEGKISMGILKSMTKEQLASAKDLYDKEQELLELSNKARKQETENIAIDFKNRGIKNYETNKEYKDKIKEINLRYNNEGEKIENDYQSKLQLLINDTFLQQKLQSNQILKLQTDNNHKRIDNQRDLELASLDLMNLTERERDKKTKEINQKYYLERVQTLDDEKDATLRALSIRHKIELREANKNNENITELQAKQKAELLDVEQKYALEYIDIEKSITTNTKDEMVKRADDAKQYIDTLSNTFSDFSSAFNANLDNLMTRRMTQIEDTYNAEVLANQMALDNKTITQEEYDKKRKEIEQKQEEEAKSLRRKQFNSNKKLQLAQATMDGASAVLSTFAGTPGGIVVKTIAASLAALFAAGQLVAIAETPFTGARGGIVPDNGKPSTVDTVPSMLAPGEAVINANSTSMFPELLNLINMAGGGKNLIPNQPLTTLPIGQPQVYNNPSSSTVRAYVVESDITSSQDRVSRIKRSVEF